MSNEIITAVLTALMSINVTATFKILYEIGGMREAISDLKTRVLQLERKTDEHSSRLHV